MKTLAFLTLMALSVGMRPVMGPADPITNSCKTQDGKDRPFPCEFQINTVFFLA